MDWKALPSLAALRAFDALARKGSLSAAGRELNVTHAAVAQHLRALEDFFAEPLAERDGQAMRLTATGHELATALNEGFDRIADGVTRIRDRSAQRPVVVSLTPAYAETWLMPRIGAFWTLHPEIDLRLAPSNALADLRRDGIDIAIRFGDGNWPGSEVEPLDMSRFVVVSAPGYSRATGLAELLAERRHTWFFSTATSEQRLWGAAIGVDFEQEKVRELPSNALVLGALRAGLGLGVQTYTLVEPDLASGALVALHEGDDSRGLGYHIVTRPGVLSPGAKAFRAWLRAAVRQANLPQTRPAVPDGPRQPTKRSSVKVRTRSPNATW